MRISTAMEPEELNEVLAMAVADEHFIACYINDALAGLAPLVQAGLREAVGAFQDAVYALGTAAFEHGYLTLMRRLLIARFEGWDTDQFDPFLWRLLHQDVVRMVEEGSAEHDPYAARFWLRVLDALEREPAAPVGAFDLSSAAQNRPQTTNLRAHALSRLVSSGEQLLALARSGSDAAHAWTALSGLAAALRWGARSIEQHIALKVESEVDEGRLSEWMRERCDRDLDIPPGAPLGFKLLLLGEDMAGLVLPSGEQAVPPAVERLLHQACAPRLAPVPAGA